MNEQGKLSIVATPIGNLEDITQRALRTLQECSVIYAEDTRVTKKLLTKYEITKALVRLDAVTEHKKIAEVVERLQRGEWIAFVSDAGTPGISDPGSRLVGEVRRLVPEASIEAIPGASALTAAISIVGADLSTFTFLGFLPHKKGRQSSLKRVSESEVPVVLYESPHRILKLLTELGERMPDTRLCVCRELTKMHEEVVSGSPSEVQEHFTQHPDRVRGEFVVIVTP